MQHSGHISGAKLFLVPALFGISACSTPPRNRFQRRGAKLPCAQSYETTSSAATATSPMGGVVTLLTGTTGSVGGTITTEARTGSWNHSTGRLELNSTGFQFVDANGFAADGTLDNGAGITGTRTDAGIAPPRSSTITGTYAYIIPFQTQQTSGTTTTQETYGVMGVVTAQADMPNGGTSTVSADFGAATVDVTINAFTENRENGVTVLPAAANMDELRGTGLVINGTNFSGGSWVASKNGAPVDLVGAAPVTSSTGAFFGYDPTISAPDEVAGMVTIYGATGLLFGRYIAD